MPEESSAKHIIEVKQPFDFLALGEEVADQTNVLLAEMHPNLGFDKATRDALSVVLSGHFTRVQGQHDRFCCQEKQPEQIKLVPYDGLKERGVGLGSVWIRTLTTEEGSEVGMNRLDGINPPLVYAIAGDFEGSINMLIGDLLADTPMEEFTILSDRFHGKVQSKDDPFPTLINPLRRGQTGFELADEICSQVMPVVDRMKLLTRTPVALGILKDSVDTPEARGPYSEVIFVRSVVNAHVGRILDELMGLAPKDPPISPTGFTGLAAAIDVEPSCYGEPKKLHKR